MYWLIQFLTKYHLTFKGHSKHLDPEGSRVQHLQLWRPFSSNSPLSQVPCMSPHSLISCGSTPIPRKASASARRLYWHPPPDSGIRWPGVLATTPGGLSLTPEASPLFISIMAGVPRAGRTDHAIPLASVSSDPGESERGLVLRRSMGQYGAVQFWTHQSICLTRTFFESWRASFCCFKYLRFTS